MPRAAAYSYWDGELIEAVPVDSTTAPVATGTELRYVDAVLGATDLYSVERSFVKHDLVFPQPPRITGDQFEPDTFGIEGHLRLSDGLQVFVNGERQTGEFVADNGIQFLNPDGTLAFEMYGVFAHDALFPEHMLPLAENTTAPYVPGWLRGTVTDNGIDLAFEIPSAWLFAQERVYPVTIDPSWGWDDVDTSIYVRERHGNLNGATRLYAGELSYSYSCGWAGWSTALDGIATASSFATACLPSTTALCP